jgi:mono/diheme cytochrome c family protein
MKTWEKSSSMANWNIRLLSVTSILLAATAAAAQTTAKTAPGGQVTFTKNVAPILQRACQNCHRTGSIAPMSLLTYQEVRPWARSIKENVAKREMPPFYIDKNVGISEFKNDASLSDAEITTIVKWVDSGAPQGNPADMPPPRQFEDSDRFHFSPDLVVQLPKDEILPARSPDTWKDILVDPHLTEDRWIQAVETKPTKGFRVVHHTVTSLVSDDTNLVPSDGGVQGTFLNEYAVGKNGDIFPEGAARLIKAGTKINFNVHLHADGEDTPLNVALAIKFYPVGYKPKHIEQTENVGYVLDLDLPPNTDNIRTDRYYTLTKPTRILSFQPHMHVRGKGLCLEAIYPGGGLTADKVETLSCVNKYRFGWHIVYMYQDDVQPLLPAGTVLHVISWHDNTAANKANPDPDNWIGFGQRSTDDMGFAWVSYYQLSDEEFKQMVLERRERQKAKTVSARLGQ